MVGGRIDDGFGVTRVLIVGAGALGQVYGRHLALGGAEVTFLVKEKYVAAAREGFTMFRLSAGGRRERVRFEGFGVVTAASPEFDEVWLAVSSDALRGPWFDELLARIGSATLVVLQPGIEERELVLGKSLHDKVVFGLPSIVSYHAPLADEGGEEGTAYLLPPLAKSVFSGPGAQAIARRLRAGGMGAGRVADAVWAGVVPTSILITHVAALELAGWSFAAARKSPHLAVAARAAREAMVVAARHFRRAPPLVRFAVRPLTMKLVGWLARLFAPFDVEAYLRVHFTKTGAQTRLLLERFAAIGEAEGVEIEALRALHSSLESP